MIGDKMLIYDKPNDMFFAGWKRSKKHNNQTMPPTWTVWARDAIVVHNLSTAYSLKEQLGPGVRIVSTTEGRKIDMLREYREEQQCKSESKT